tara:strand:+ start:118 stop:579 length:462 start_codon:yes stop_codon:yes gene_type:complete
MPTKQINQYTTEAASIPAGSFIDIDLNTGTIPSPVYDSQKLDPSIACLPFLQWTGILSQSGVVAPTVEAENRNSLGGTVVFTYIAAGSYRGTLTGAFSTQDKFHAMCNIGSSGGDFYVRWETANSFFIFSHDHSGATADNLLNFSQLQITIHP